MSHILLISPNFITHSIKVVDFGMGRDVMPGWINIPVWSITGARVTADSLIAR